MEQIILNAFPKLETEDTQQFKTVEEFALTLCEKHLFEKHKHTGANSNLSRVYRAATAADQINLAANKATIETWYNLVSFMFIMVVACYFYRPVIAGMVLVMPILMAIAPHPMTRKEMRIVKLATMLHNIRHKDFCESVKECTNDIQTWLETNIAEYRIINEILIGLETGKYNGRFWLAYQHVRVASILEDYNPERKYQSYVQRHSSFTPADTWTTVIRDYRMEVLKHVDSIELHYLRELVKFQHKLVEADINAHEITLERLRARAKEEAAAAAAAAAAKKAAPVWD